MASGKKHTKSGAVQSSENWTLAQKRQLKKDITKLVNKGLLPEKYKSYNVNNIPKPSVARAVESFRSVLSGQAKVGTIRTKEATAAYLSKGYAGRKETRKIVIEKGQYVITSGSRKGLLAMKERVGQGPELRHVILPVRHKDLEEFIRAQKMAQPKIGPDETYGIYYNYGGTRIRWRSQYANLDILLQKLEEYRDASSWTDEEIIDGIEIVRVRAGKQRSWAQAALREKKQRRDKWVEEHRGRRPDKGPHLPTSPVGRAIRREKQREYSKKYYAKNKKRILARQKQRYWELRGLDKK